jgi:thioredoxin-related protein
MSIALSAEAGVWHKKVASAQAEAKKKNQLIFVDLFAEWCGWCHRMEREVFPSEAFQNATRDMVLLRLNTEDRGEGTQWAQDYGVTSLPTFVVLTPEMTVAGIIRGYAVAPDFVATMKRTIQGYRDYEKKLTTDTTLAADKRLELYRELVGRHAFADAETRLTKFLASKVTPPVRAEGSYWLALSQASQKKYAVAVKTIDDATKLKPTGKPLEQLKFLKAQIYAEQNQLQAALAELKSFKSSYPNSELILSVNRLTQQLESSIKTQ